MDRAHSTGYTHAASGLLASITETNPAGQQATTTVDPASGAPTTAVDPNGKTTTAAYDGLGRLTGVWLPGRSTSLPGNVEYGYSVTKTAPSWTSTAELAPAGNQVSSYDILDGLGRPRQTQTPAPAANGGRVVADTRYDGRGLPAVTSRFWNSTSGPSATLVSFADADIPAQRRASYDGLGRQLSDELWSLGVEKWRASIGYDGDRILLTPPEGGTATTTIIDVYGQTVALRQHSTDPTPTGPYQETGYLHDELGRLVAATDPAGNSWTWSYDLRGRITATTDPDRGATGYTYDDADQLATVTDSRGSTLAFAHDQLGRVSSLWTDAVGTGVKHAEWVYDSLAAGQLTSATRYEAGSAYTHTVTGYDDSYRPLGITDTLPAGEGSLAGDYTTGYSYHVDGSPATTSLPAAGGLPAETITTGYDSAGYPSTVAGMDTYLADIAYYSWGPAHQQLLGASPRQVRLTQTVDEATGQLAAAAVHTENPASPGSFDELRTDAYTHNPAGLLVATSQTLTGAVVSTQCFGYDRLARLVDAHTTTQATCPTGPPTPEGPEPYWTSWTYDPVGNRTSQTQHGLAGAGDTTTAYTHPTPGGPQPHTLTGATTTGPGGTTVDSYGYDSAGNTTTRTLAGINQTLTWDPEGHLASHSINAQTTAYTYTPDGQRLIRHDPDGAATAYLPGQELHKNPAGQVAATRYYTTPDGATIASRDPAGLTWLAGDHHGSAHTAITAATLTTTTRRYTPFGQPRGTNPAWPNDKTFVAGTQDPTGLVHLGAREYDPTTGRFLSLDPLIDLADPRQWHGYAYAENNPTSYTDPDGQMKFIGDSFIGGGGGPGWKGGGAAAGGRINWNNFWNNRTNTTRGNRTGATRASTGRTTTTNYRITAQYETSTIRAEKAAMRDRAAQRGAAATPRPSTPAKPTTTVPSTTRTPRTTTTVRSTSPGSSNASAPRAGGNTAEIPEIKAGAVGGPTAGKRFPETVRQGALAENPSTCVYCRMQTDNPQVDHAISRARGGNATFDNAQTTCPHCNGSKGARDFPVTPPAGYRGPWPPPWWELP